MVRLLHGRPLAAAIRARSKERSAVLHTRGVMPRLTVVSVGTDPASITYSQRLVRSGRASRISVDEVTLPADISERELVLRLESFAHDAAVNGILLLTPLPGALDEGHIVDHIASEKDVEGMNPFSVGLLADGRPKFVPSTAEAVLELLKFYEVPLAGTRATVIGRSTVIGRPVAYLLLKEDATVTIAHRRTTDLRRSVRDAAIVVVAVGRPGFLTGDLIAPGATVIDAGVNVTPQGVTGDVDVASVSAVAGALSPVPGGLGAVTTELLLRNVLTATERQLAG